MLVALAGRRIDSADARHPAFPLHNVARVRSDLRQLFKELRPTTLICSAACGADLIALAEASQIGIRCRIILPSDRKLFRATSVVDRAGDWGSLYDEILSAAEARGDVLELHLSLASDEAFVIVNQTILDQAGADAIAVLVWEGFAREGFDLTKSFADAAREKGLQVFEVMTA